MTDAARRPIGQARTRLEYADIRSLVAELPAHLRALQHACATASAAVATRYFQHAAPVSWEHEGV
jgi:A predicted alpha-helical domain with a conserved ER motif.